MFRSASGLLTFNVTTSTGTTNGLLGAGPAFATAYGGITWATIASGSIVGLTTFSTNLYAPGDNTDVTMSQTLANLGSVTTNSLRFNFVNQTLTLAGSVTLQSGGILVTPRRRRRHDHRRDIARRQQRRTDRPSIQLQQFCH